jgi:hypothetical protein
MLRLIRKAAALERVLPTFAFSSVENTECRKWKSPRSCCGRSTPEVPRIAVVYYCLLRIIKARDKDKTFI